MFKCMIKTAYLFLILSTLPLLGINMAYGACEAISPYQEIIHPLPFSTMSPSGVSENPMVITFSTPAVQFNCDSGQYYLVAKLDGGTGPMVNENGASIYATNIDSLGISIDFHGGNVLGDKHVYHYVSDSANTIDVTVKLIKMNGDALGGMLDASSFPSIIIYATQSSSGEYIDGQSVELARMSLSGQVSYVVPTCFAESNEVQMGSYSMQYFSSQKRNNTEWVDASINLICDAPFEYSHHITFSAGNQMAMDSSNQYSVNIDAVNGLIDAERGIMSLDEGGASGIGIQISRDRLEHAWTEQWSADTRYGSHFINIPLYARYIKIEDKVAPGRAHGKLIYTIQYK